MSLKVHQPKGFGGDHYPARVSKPKNNHISLTAENAVSEALQLSKWALPGLNTIGSMKRPVRDMQSIRRRL